MRINPKSKYGSAVLIIFAVQLFYTALMFGGLPLESDDNGVVSDSAPGINNINTVPVTPESSQVISWWNESYDYRLRVEVNNPYSFTISKPIDLYLTFGSGKCNIDSIRLVKYDEVSDLWTPVPLQVWNTTTGNPDATHLASATLTFVVNDLPPGTSVYYIYYDPDETYDPTDYSGRVFSVTHSANYTSITWDDVYGRQYTAEWNVSKGMYTLSDNYGYNFHTVNSTAPGLVHLDEDLIGYWTFDNQDFVEDTGHLQGGAGTAYNLYGNIYYDTGISGYAAYFDGASDYVYMNADQDLYGGYKSTRGITLMAWVKPAGTGERIIMSWDRSEYWRFALDTYNRVYFATTGNDRAIDDMYGATSIPNDGQWHHVAVVWDPVNHLKKIYVDGVLDAQKTAHTTSTTLGSGVRRYGFFGTGSEASVWPDHYSRNTPRNWYDGAMDEVRIYNRSLTDEEIKLAMNMAYKTSVIYNVTEQIAVGPVMAAYKIKWSSVMFSATDKMDVNDTIYFYRGLNMFKVTRTFKWNFVIAPPNNAFAAYNTLFNWDPNDVDPTYQDYYYYDGQIHEGHNNVDFTVENYTVLHDYDATLHSAAVGLFVTKLEKGYWAINFSYLKWKIDVNKYKKIVNFVPGNETDLDIKSTLPDYTVTVTFWEYIRDDFVMEPTSAVSYFNNIYTSLKNPLNVTVGTEETIFFNLRLHMKDYDGLSVPGVNVTLLNAADNSTVNWSISDSNGNVTFQHIQQGNYLINLTYKPYDTHDALWLGTYPITVNQTTTTYQNTKCETYTLNLTSVVINFKSLSTGQLLVGASIEFRVNSSNVYSFIGTETTDSFGNVTFRWRRMNATLEQIDFRCGFLGSYRLFNISIGAAPTENISIPFESRSYYTATVQIDEFETNMTVIDETPDYTYGQPLTYSLTYNYTLGGTVYPIENATVTYVIQYRSTVIAAGNFPSTDSNGHSSKTIDYITEGIPLETGKVYALKVTASKPGYMTVTQTVNFELLDIPTTLTANSTNITVYWGRNIPISVYFYDTYYDTAVSGATVTYSVIGKTISGNITADASKGAGWYTVNLNSTDFGTAGTYSVKVTADKANYAYKELIITVNIIPITTNLTSLQSGIDVYWLENFSINVKFEDTLLSVGITGASVKWSIVQNPSINGEFTPDSGRGDGWYSLTLNSTVLNYAGHWTMQITATKENYVAQSIYIPIQIREIFTRINGTVTSISEITIFRTEVKMLYFNYTYRVGGETSTVYKPVENAAYTTYEWESTDNPDLSGSGTLTYDPTTKLYVLDFDTETRPIGTYSITVRLEQINYVTRVAIILLHVVPMRFNITFAAGTNYNPADQILKYTVKQDETVVMRLNLIEVLNGSAGEANVYWISGDTKLPFENLGNGTYQLSIKADVNAFFQQQLIEGKIVIEAPEHESVNITTQIVVKMPEIIEGVPTFYMLLVVGFVAVFVGTIGGYKAIQSARIPAFIKKATAVEKAIRKNKEIDARVSIMEPRSKKLVDMFSEYWEFLGLDVRKAFGFTESERPEESADSAGSGRNPDEELKNEGGSE